MRIENINSLEDMEEYIISKNYRIDCFEDSILQFYARTFMEKQLFFIIKNNAMKNIDLENLKIIYREVIDGKYSPHQLQRVGFTNNWIRGINYEVSGIPIETVIGWQNSNKEILRKKGFEYTWDDRFTYRMVEGSLEEVFKDRLSILLDDKDICIFTITIKINKIKSEQNDMLYFENGYQLNPQNSSQVIPYQNGPYIYHYYRVPFINLKQLYGVEINEKITNNRIFMTTIQNRLIGERNSKEEEEEERCNLVLTNTKKVS